MSSNIKLATHTAACRLSRRINRAWIGKCGLGLAAIRRHPGSSTWWNVCWNNSPLPVRVLLKYNPFPEQPPRYVRAVLYDYQFTNLTERAASGDPWKRAQLGLYMPEASIKEN